MVSAGDAEQLAPQVRDRLAALAEALFLSTNYALGPPCSRCHCEFWRSPNAPPGLPANVCACCYFTGLQPAGDLRP